LIDRKHADIKERQETVARSGKKGVYVI